MQHLVPSCNHHHDPLPPAHYPRHLSTLQNGRVRTRCSSRRALRKQRACEEPAAAPKTGSILTARSWIFRENRVPHYQREFQKHDGVRLWQKVRRRLCAPERTEEC